LAATRVLPLPSAKLQQEPPQGPNLLAAINNFRYYTLWLYYLSLTSQTLYTAVNDFVDPKLKHVTEEVAALRAKGGARSRDDDKKLEALQALETELSDLRDALLRIVPTYRPNHDDGVQITAAPL
jgi:hypothetical protein